MHTFMHTPGNKGKPHIFKNYIKNGQTMNTIDAKRLSEKFSRQALLKSINHFIKDKNSGTTKRVKLIPKNQVYKDQSDLDLSATIIIPSQKHVKAMDHSLSAI